MNVVNWSEVIKEIFGDFESEERSDDWEKVKASLKKDEEVSGTVVARAPFGVWLDLGVGFPALIETIVITGMDRNMYEEDNYCPVGSIVRAKVSGIRDNQRQIYLHQKDWPFKINDTLKNT